MKGWLKYWRVTLALLAVFLAGGVMGFIGGAAAAKQKMQQLNVPESWASLMMRRMNQELDLTAEQRQQVTPLLRTASRDLSTVRRQAALSSMQHLRTFYTSLEPILTPEQKRKLEIAKERMKHRLREGGENRPFGPGGPKLPPFPFPPRPPGPFPGKGPVDLGEKPATAPGRE